MYTHTHIHTHTHIYTSICTHDIRLCEHMIYVCAHTRTQHAYSMRMHARIGAHMQRQLYDTCILHARIHLFADTFAQSKCALACAQVRGKQADNT